MTTTDQERHEAIYRARRERFNAILDGYECGAGHWRADFPGPLTTGRIPVDATHAKPGRWALVTENPGFGYFVENVEQRHDIERVAARDVQEGRQPVCFYDLDTLAGDEPEPGEDDVIELLDGAQSLPAFEHPGPYVIDSTETKDGETTLNLSFDGERAGWCYVYECRVIERGEPDERMPVRYLLARIETFVAFNSTPGAGMNDEMAEAHSKDSAVEQELSKDRYEQTFCFHVDGREDGLYTFAREEDRDRFALAVAEAGGEGHADDQPVNDRAGTDDLIRAELDEPELPDDVLEWDNRDRHERQ